MVHTREPQRNFLPNPSFSDGCWNGPRDSFKHSLNDTKQKLNQFLKFNDVKLKSVTKVLDNYRSDCFFVTFHHSVYIWEEKWEFHPACLKTLHGTGFMKDMKKKKDFSRPIEKLKEIYSMQISISKHYPFVEKSDFYEVNPIFRTHKKLPKGLNKLGIISGNLFF